MTNNMQTYSSHSIAKQMLLPIFSANDCVLEFCFVQLALYSYPLIISHFNGKCDAAFFVICFVPVSSFCVKIYFLHKRQNMQIISSKNRNDAHKKSVPFFLQFYVNGSMLLNKYNLLEIVRRQEMVCSSAQPIFHFLFVFIKFYFSFEIIGGITEMRYCELFVFELCLVSFRFYMLLLLLLLLLL